MLVQYERIGWVSFKKLFLIIFFFSNFKYLTFRVTIIFFFLLLLNGKPVPQGTNYFVK